jgi:hypothetical protein
MILTCGSAAFGLLPGLRRAARISSGDSAAAKNITRARVGQKRFARDARADEETGGLFV